MDERLLFDKFHEALDVDPRPAAYERLRSALIAKPSTPRRRAAFQMRWTRMGFRLAAAIVLVAVAVTAGAVFLATHRVANNNVPATHARDVAGYQRLTSQDELKVVNSYSNHCSQLDDSGCPAATQRIIDALGQWRNDLDRQSPPAEFAAIDGQIRLHIDAAVSDLRDTVTAQQAKNSPAMAAALAAALEEANWLDSTKVAIAGAHTSTAADYLTSVRGAKSALDTCVQCLDLTTQPAASCASNPYPSCDLEVLEARNAVAVMQQTVVFTIAPSSLEAKDAQLQADLSRADTTLIAMRKALRTGDLAGWDSGRTDFHQTLTAIDQDCGAILAS